MAQLELSDGVRLYYEVRGTGPPLYVCHGGPVDRCDTIMRELGPLEGSFTLVFHDYRGSGASSCAPESTYRFGQLAGDLESLRQHLGHDEVSILAHSMGGFVALDYVRAYPERTRCLVLISTTPTAALRRVLVPTLLALGPRRTFVVVTRLLSYLAKWSWRRESSARRLARTSILLATQTKDRSLTSVESAGDNHNARRLEAEMMHFDAVDRLATTSTPTLVVYGSEDAVMVAGGRILANHLPRVHTLALPRCGHEPHVECTDVVLDAVREFAFRPENALSR